MKTCLAVALVIGFALSAFAQPKDTVDPKIIEQIDALGKKYDEAVNNNDAAALAALYTDNAVLVTDTGPIYGREAIQTHFADLFQQWHFSNDQYFPYFIGMVGNEVLGNGEWSDTLQGKSGDPFQVKGYWGDVYVREGNEWKIRLDTCNITPTLAPTATE